MGQPGARPHRAVGLLLGRQDRVASLVDHFENPRHEGVLGDANVRMPGGGPECGGSVVVYLKGNDDGRIAGLSFTGEGDIISMGATSIIMQKVHEKGLTMDEILDLDYGAFVEELGNDVVGSRIRNATLGLSTLKSAIRRYRQGLNPRSGDTPREGVIDGGE
jgi:nitrogen fixation NifU-like protein